MARGGVRSRSPGSYEIRWEGAVGPEGKRRQLSKTLRGVTKKQAQAELRREQDEVLKTDAERASEMLVKECCKLFLKEWGAGKLRPRSVECYESFFKNYLLPQCGDIPLVSVGRSDLQSVINAMIANGLADVTIKGKCGLLSGFFSWVVRAEYLHVSPVRGLTVPEPSGKTAGQILSGPEAVNMLAALEGTECWLPTCLALYTGMRPGEVLGLCWDDVDLVEGTVSVRHTMHRRKGAVYLGPPKTGTSQRSVAVSTEVVQVLRELEEPANYWWLRRSGREAVPVDFRQVCARADGKILTEDFWRNAFHSVLRHEGLKEIRLHDLRHTHASLLLLDNVPVIVVSKRLGHADIQTTINLYGHLLPNSDPEAAARFAGILGLAS